MADDVLNYYNIEQLNRFDGDLISQDYLLVRVSKRTNMVSPQDMKVSIGDFLRGTGLDTKVDKHGDVMVGELLLANRVFLGGLLTTGEEKKIAQIDDKNVLWIGDEALPLRVRAVQNPTVTINNKQETFYHTGFKPSATDVGAWSKLEADQRFLMKSVSWKQNAPLTSRSADIIDSPDMWDAGFSGYYRTNDTLGFKGLTVHIAHPKFTNGAHARGFTFEYGGTGTGTKVYVYGYDKDGAKQSNYKVYTEADKPTPTEIGAYTQKEVQDLLLQTSQWATRTFVDVVGDTMTGALTLNGEDDNRLVLKNKDDMMGNFIHFVDSTGSSVAQMGKDIGDNNFVIINTKDNTSLTLSTDRVVSDKNLFVNNFKVYHEGFKPTFADAGAVSASRNLGTTDLDTIRGNQFEGNWHQRNDTDATTGRHYPVALGGTLTVYMNGINGCVQVYRAKSGNKVYQRTYDAAVGQWAAWVKIFNGEFVPTGSDIPYIASQNVFVSKGFKPDADFTSFNDAPRNSTFFGYQDADNAPVGITGTFVDFNSSGYHWQMGTDYRGGGKFGFRTFNADNSTWSDWGYLFSTKYLPTADQVTGLGTAAKLNAQTSLTDSDSSKLMKVGAFGLGTRGTQLTANSDFGRDYLGKYDVGTGFFFSGNDITGAVTTSGWKDFILLRHNDPTNPTATWATALEMSQSGLGYHVWENGTHKKVKVYSEMNKPTAADVGAISEDVIWGKVDSLQKRWTVGENSAGGWWKICEVAVGQNGLSAEFDFVGGRGFNGQFQQQGNFRMVLRTSNNTPANVNEVGRAELSVYLEGSIFPFGAMGLEEVRANVYAIWWQPTSYAYGTFTFKPNLGYKTSQELVWFPNTGSASKPTTCVQPVSIRRVLSSNSDQGLFGDTTGGTGKRNWYKITMAGETDHGFYGDSTYFQFIAQGQNVLSLSNGRIHSKRSLAVDLAGETVAQLRLRPTTTTNPSFLIRNDGTNTYFMLTNPNDADGNYNSLRPVYINNTNGGVNFGENVYLSKNFTMDGVASMGAQITWNPKGSGVVPQTRATNIRLWGTSARQSVFECSDTKGWHWFSQRVNADDAAVQFAINGNLTVSDITANVVASQANNMWIRKDGTKAINFQNTAGTVAARVKGDDNGRITLEHTGRASWYFHDKMMQLDTGGTVTGEAMGLVRGQVQGGSWSSWRARAAGLLVDCQDSVNSAHTIWKATHWGKYHLACLHIHGTSDINTVNVKMNVHNAEFNFNASGDFTASRNGSFNDVYIRSDRRLKKDLVKIDSALDKVCKLSGYTYDKLAALGSDKVVGREAGIIAQTLQEVLPEAVTESKDTEDNTILVVSGSAVNALLVEAIKELKERVDELSK